MRSPRLILAAAGAAQAAFSLVAFALPAIGPEIAERYDLSLAELGLVLTANILGQGLSLLWVGVAVDRWGGRIPTVCGTVVATGGLLAAAFAPSVSLLVPSLFVAGIGAAAVPITSMGAIFTVFPSRRRAWALGVRQMGVPMAGVIGAFLMPALEAAGGVRLALLVCAGAAGVFGLGFVAYGAQLAEPARPRHNVRAGLLQIARAPGMARLLVVAVFYIVVLQAGLAYLVPAARDAGLSPLWSSVVFFVMQVAAAISRVAWGRRADRDGGRRRTRTLVEAGWAASIGTALLAALLYAGPGAVIIGAVGFAFGVMGWNAVVYVTAGERGPVGLTAQSVALAAAVIFTVAAVSSPAMGAIAAELGWRGFWLLCAGIAVVGALVARGLSDDGGSTDAESGGPATLLREVRPG